MGEIEKDRNTFNLLIFLSLSPLFAFHEVDVVADVYSGVLGHMIKLLVSHCFFYYHK